jgi:hypothetical protein
MLHYFGSPPNHRTSWSFPSHDVHPRASTSRKCKQEIRVVALIFNPKLLEETITPNHVARATQGTMSSIHTTGSVSSEVNC